MPLTAKGETIKAAMTKEYGEKKGESVFYAMENAGKLHGITKKEGETSHEVHHLHSKGSVVHHYHHYDDGAEVVHHHQENPKAKVKHVVHTEKDMVEAHAEEGLKKAFSSDEGE